MGFVVILDLLRSTSNSAPCVPKVAIVMLAVLASGAAAGLLCVSAVGLFALYELRSTIFSVAARIGSISFFEKDPVGPIAEEFFELAMHNQSNIQYYDHAT